MLFDIFRRLFCLHEWVVIEKEVREHDYIYEHLNKRGVKQFSNCSKCGAHRERWLYVDYKRKHRFD